MTLNDYLQTEQARDDVRALLARWTAHHGTTQSHIGPNGQILHASLADAWTRVELATGKDWRPMAYYRPEGDRYIVTDLGEGVRALRLKGCALRDVKPRLDNLFLKMFIDKLLHSSYGPAALIEGEIGTFGMVTAADLPDALCRVMLASLRVASCAP